MCGCKRYLFLNISYLIFILTTNILNNIYNITKYKNDNFIIIIFILLNIEFILNFIQIYTIMIYRVPSKLKYVILTYIMFSFFCYGFFIIQLNKNNENKLYLNIFINICIYIKYIIILLYLYYIINYEYNIIQNNENIIILFNHI